MRRTFHPAMFLGTVVVLCTAWLWARPPVVAVDPFARNEPRRAAPVDPTPIALDTAILERYAGQYEGRGDLTVGLTLKDGKLFAQSPGTIALEFLPTSETEFHLKGMGWHGEFDVSGDGTVRGFAVNTEYGLIEVKRVR